MIRNLTLILFLAFVYKASLAQDTTGYKPAASEPVATSTGDTLLKRNGKIRKYNNSFITAGFGPAFHYIHDPMATPLLYRSAGVKYAQLGFRQRGLKHYNIYEMLIGQSQLNDTESGTYYYQSYQFTLKAHYEKYWRYKKSLLHNRVQWWPGGSADLLINSRYLPVLGNSGDYYDYSLSLSAASRFETSFKLFKRNLRAAWQVNLPMITAITRPNFAGISNFVTGNDDDLLEPYTNNMRLVSFNQYFLLRSTLELCYPLGNRNMFMFTYQWQGQNYYNDEFRLQATYSAFMFHFIFKLDKNKNL